jgi:hypothetical protein
MSQNILLRRGHLSLLYNIGALFKGPPLLFVTLSHCVPLQQLGKRARLGWMVC